MTTTSFERVERSRSVLWLALLASLLITGFTARTSNAQDGGIAVGATAPGAALITLDGKPADLSQYIGKSAVVLEFWATWCPLCRDLEPSMAAAQKAYAGRVAFVSIGVSDNQSTERQRGYVEGKKLGGTFLFDRDGKAVAAYRVPHTSYVVVIDPSGKVVYTGVGKDQNIPAAVARAFPRPRVSSR